MCGLVGIAGEHPTYDDTMRMLARVRHRGPDGEGVHVSPFASVGHVRLAIVDPTEAGAQPMSTPDGRYVLAYNGELYNHADFRSDLEQRGVRFRGHSDTETLLWLLVHYGERILPRLNGIFAFAFLDAETGTVLLARDHLGVKPLYYARTPRGRVLFASEIKALFATGEVEPRANVDDLVELFMFHFISGERTAFAGIQELRPGHALTFSRGALRLERFWSPVPAGPTTDAETHEELNRLLQAGVERQLMADVPIGIMSSGGVDSSVVTAFAGLAQNRMTGFCYRDPHAGYDELGHARELSAAFGVTVDEVRVEAAEIPSLLMKLAWHYDEPLPRPHHLAAYAIARQAQASGLKVLVSGEGGDEIFGGYTRYVDVAADMARSGDSSLLVFGHNRGALPRIARFWSKTGFENDYRFQCARETEGFDPINRQLLIDQQTFLQHFLQRADRMGMAASVEVRVPLLDLCVVEHTNRLPGRFKIAGACTKLCLKAAMQNILPGTVLHRPKQAFELPMTSLMRSGPVAAMLDDFLLSSPRCGVLFDARKIAELVHDFRSGQEDLWKMVWLLLTTEIWMRTFKVTV